MKFAWILSFVSFAAIASAGCSTLPPAAYGSARLAPVKYVDPAHTIEDCVRVPFPQCSGGN